MPISRTPPDDPRGTEFRRRRRLQFWVTILSVGAVVAVLTLLPGVRPLKIWLLIGIFGIHVLFTVRNWRCPHCGLPLPGAFTIFYTKCPRCEARINPWIPL